MTKNDIKKLLDAAMPDAVITVTGDDGRHFEAEVIWAGFTGKTPIAQHRIVYAALGDKMGGEIHALKLRTHAPKAPCA
jgi:acid stress-induced BolA-like protein IbaG/YrbA